MFSHAQNFSPFEKNQMARRYSKCGCHARLIGKTLFRSAVSGVILVVEILKNQIKSANQTQLPNTNSPARSIGLFVARRRQSSIAALGRLPAKLDTRPGEVIAERLHGPDGRDARRDGGHARPSTGVLTAADAAMWLDPDLPADQAEHLLRSIALGPEAFDWFKVDRAVGNVRSQGPKMATSIE